MKSKFDHYLEVVHPMGKYGDRNKTLIKKAYEWIKKNGPMKYSEFQELFATGSIGQWSSKDRKEHAGLATTQLQYILPKYFIKVDGKYDINPETENEVSGEFKPFKGVQKKAGFLNYMMR